VEGEVTLPYERCKPQLVRVRHDGFRQPDVYLLLRRYPREALASSQERAVQEVVALLGLFGLEARREMVHEQTGGDQADQEERAQQESAAPGDRASPLATKRGCMSVHNSQNLSRLGHITREPGQKIYSHLVQSLSTLCPDYCRVLSRLKRELKLLLVIRVRLSIDSCMTLSSHHAFLLETLHACCYFHIFASTSLSEFQYRRNLVT